MVRYAIAAAALLGASTPAMAVVQAIQVTGTATGYGEANFCRQSPDYTGCTFSPFVAPTGFSFTLNVDNELNGTSALLGYGSLNNSGLYFVVTGIDVSQIMSSTHISFARSIDFATAQPGLLYDGSAGLTAYIGGWGDCHGSSCYNYIDYFNLRGLTNVHITITGLADPVFPSGYLGLSPIAVPESATWALMLLGFGVTGAAFRRRRSAAIA